MFCIKCGEKLNDEAMFCTKCGTPTQLAQTQSVGNQSVQVQNAAKPGLNPASIIITAVVTAVIVIALFLVVNLFSKSSTALTGTYGSYSEYYNDYYWTIEFNSDGSCVVKPLYEGYVSGTYKKGDNGKYTLIWDKYYGSWIAEVTGDELFIKGTGLGVGATFEKIN